MLKHSLLTLMLAGAVCAAAPFVVAQDSGAAPQQSAPEGAPPEHGRGGHMDPAMRTERLTKQLNLTSDQQAKVLDILKSAQSKMQDLRSDSSVPQEDRRSKMMEIHKTSDDQIRALLDANQQKKFDAMQAKREQWQGQGRPQGGQGASAPNSPQQQ